jgi:hypothetical protein
VSFGHGVGDGQQVGRALIGGIDHAALWTGSAASFVDLHPAGSNQSRAIDAAGGWQAGYARFGAVEHASLWNSTASSWEDLSLALTGSWGITLAHGVWLDGTTLSVAGWGFNNDTQRNEALLWTREVPAPGSAALLALGGIASSARRRR